MSAVEEYRKYMADRKSMLRSRAESLADAAIAELEAERDWNLAELNKWRENAEDWQAELAALKARRCEGCVHPLYSKDGTAIYRNTTHHRCPMFGKKWDRDFACNRWAARDA